MTAISPKEEYYLSCIRLAVEIRERQAPFDLLFRRWWAAGANDCGMKVDHPDWVFSSSGVAPNRVDFVSSEATKVSAGVDSQRLHVMAAIPDLVLRDLLIDGDIEDVSDLRLVLKRWCRFGALTGNDLNRLTSHALEHAMPPGWTVGDSIYSRFEAAGIPVQDTGNLKTAKICAPLTTAESEARCRNGSHQLLSSTALLVHPW